MMSCSLSSSATVIASLTPNNFTNIKIHVSHVLLRVCYINCCYTEDNAFIKVLV